MSKRYIVVLAVCAALIALVLLLPSAKARAGVAILLALTNAVLLIQLFVTKTSKGRVLTNSVRSQIADDESSQEIFALGKLFEATMSGMREGLLVVDQDLRVVASNNAAHRLFNLSHSKLNAQRLTELTRNPAVYGAFLDALKGEERSGVKIETHGPERLVFDLRVVPLMSGKGRAADGRTAQGALGVFIDVTRIEQLEHVRQEFLSNVSHELRTPLTAILAFIETLEAGAIDDREASQRFLSIIRRNATRMHDLIDDILELSAIEAGNVQVKAEEVELSPIVTDVIASLAGKAAAAGIGLTNDVAREVMVFADARKLEQMLTNLVENGIKFNRPNGRVTIRFERGLGSDAEGRRGQQMSKSEAIQRYRIIVEDTGEGIPAQHLERLFERFYRVDRARSRDLGGTGLGLAIVKHLARAHGGEVSVSSELGKGSTFIIELPAKQNQPAERPTA